MNSIILLVISAVLAGSVGAFLMRGKKIPIASTVAAGDKPWPAWIKVAAGLLIITALAVTYFNKGGLLLEFVYNNWPVLIVGGIGAGVMVCGTSQWINTEPQKISMWVLTVALVGFVIYGFLILVTGSRKTVDTLVGNLQTQANHGVGSVSSYIATGHHPLNWGTIIGWGFIALAIGVMAYLLLKKNRLITIPLGIAGTILVLVVGGYHAYQLKPVGDAFRGVGVDLHQVKTPSLPHFTHRTRVEKVFGGVGGHGKRLLPGQTMNVSMVWNSDLVVTLPAYLKPVNGPAALPMWVCPTLDNPPNYLVGVSRYFTYHEGSDKSFNIGFPSWVRQKLKDKGDIDVTLTLVYDPKGYPCTQAVLE